jgi:soluble lytic murein transglycosylase-like protein
MASGITTNGRVRWFAYNALGWSDRSQVRHLLYRTAATHHLPARLLLAIAWQESGWRQHVISSDGGIGVMQLMPTTAMGINASLGKQLDPYDLQDNLDLGATYLQWLWQNFHGDLPRVISGYNEGGWAVKHRGIFNWRYVHNVLALMHDLS